MKPAVSISCITYNHAPFIRACLDSFLMQQTNFAFEVIIHDDASTDGTREIIEEYVEKYPDVFFPLFQTENQYSQGVRGMMPRFNFPRCRGKYIAICEGDDYWTDLSKLQKQVDFLENNLDYTLVVGGYKSLNSSTGEIKNEIRNIDSAIDSNDKGFEITVERFLEQWLTKSLTLVFRKESFNFKIVKKYKYFRDVHLNYSLLRLGKGYYMKEVLGVYRIHPGGIFSEISEQEKYSSYLNTYGELYRKNKADIFLKRKYYNLLKSALSNNYLKEKKFNAYFKMFMISKSQIDLKKLTKALIHNN